MKIIVIATIIAASMLIVGCASYQGERAKPAGYYKDGKPVPGDCRVESVFKF